MKTSFTIIFFLIIKLSLAQQSQEPPKLVAGFPVNYDEDAIPPYTLPELLTLENGQKVTNSDTWMNERRPELLNFIAELQYGKTPPAPKSIAYEVVEK